MRLIEAGVHRSFDDDERISRIVTTTGRVRVWVSYAIEGDTAPDELLENELWLRTPHGERALCGGGGGGGGPVVLRSLTRVTFDASVSGAYWFEVFAIAPADDPRPPRSGPPHREPVVTLPLHVEVG